MELPETITTERLLLRQPRLADAQSVFEEYGRDPEVSRYLAWRPLESIQQAEEFLTERVLAGWSSGKEFSWGITRPGSDTLIGMIAYRPDGDEAELGFVLGRNFWRLGYMTEAALAVMAQAFSLLRVRRIWAVCDFENLASVRVLEKIGMAREEILPRWTVRPNLSSEPRDCFLFAKTRRAFDSGEHSIHDSMTFREANIEDIPALSEIRLSVQENALSNPELITREMYETHLRDIGKGWLCEIEGEVVGFSIVSLRDASIWALFVKPAHEGKGIGKRLLDLATAWLFESGVSSITLSTAVGTRADRWYEGLGWKRGKLKANGEVCYRLD